MDGDGLVFLDHCTSYFCRREKNLGRGGCQVDKVGIDSNSGSLRRVLGLRERITYVIKMDTGQVSLGMEW